MASTKDANLNAIVTSTSDNVVEEIEKWLTDTGSAEELATFYDKWAATYDKDLEKARTSDENKMHRCVADGLANYYRTNKDIRILDVAAGTGSQGVKLAELGFTNVDALDGSQGMLDKAKEKNVYKNFLCEFCTENKLQSVADGSYDALITVGSFAPGHLMPSCLGSLIRAVKQGGYMSIGVLPRLDHPELKNFDPEVRRLETEGKWKIMIYKPVENYLGNETGMLYVMQVI